MSQVNEALKKAQKERDVRHLKYEGFFAASRKKRNNFKGKVLWWTLACVIVVVALVLQYRSWLDDADRQPTPASDDKIRKSVPINEPTSVEKAREIYKRAKIFHNDGRLSEAKRLYQETLKLDPGYVDALNNLGVIFIQETNYLAAQRQFEKAMRLKPSYAEPFYNLACLYAIKGELKQSLEILKRAVSIDSAAREWARRDSDLENLRGTPEFESIVAKGGPSHP